MTHATPQRPGFMTRGLRCTAAVSMLAAALLLSACGGGGDSGSFDISVVVAGQPVGGAIGPGSSPTIYLRAGQSIELDASEPVVWTLYVGGAAVSGSGSTVYYSGVYVTLTSESASRIAVDTYAQFPLTYSVPMTLVATSTLDAAQVATVNVLITN